MNPGLFAKLPYDAGRDFAPITLIASSPLLLLVHPSVPVKTVKCPLPTHRVDSDFPKADSASKLQCRPYSVMLCERGSWWKSTAKTSCSSFYECLGRSFAL